MPQRRALGIVDAMSTTMRTTTVTARDVRVIRLRLSARTRKFVLLVHIPPVVSSTAVLVAMALSVFKPWRRARRVSTAR